MWPALTETDVCFQILQLSASLGWGRASWEHFFLADVAFYVSVSKSQNKFYHRVPQNRVAAFWVVASLLKLALTSLHIPTQKLYPTYTQCPCLRFMATLKFQVHLVCGFVVFGFCSCHCLLICFLETKFHVAQADLKFKQDFPCSPG